MKRNNLIYNAIKVEKDYTKHENASLEIYF